MGNMGYIKIWRKIEDNPHFRDPEALALWVWLLRLANWKERDELLGGKRITCKPGQFTTGRKQLSEKSGISESKVERILNLFESEQQIEQQKTSTNRLVSITNWSKYQQDEQQIEQQVNNDRTTSEQQVNTLESLKKNKNKEAACADPRFKECISIFDAAWKLNRKGPADYKGMHTAQLKALLTAHVDITGEDFKKACLNCLADDFHGNNFSLGYVATKYSILLNLVQKPKPQPIVKKQFTGIGF